ncbi:MAG: TfoX/Sxy family protein [Bacteroidia bacterium]
MAYNPLLGGRIRIRLNDLKNVEERAMMGGLAFMVNGKMCVGVIADEMMCRLDPEFYTEALKRKGAREMDFTGRPMKGYVMVNQSGMKSEKDFDFWIQQCLDFNPKAKASKKKK